MRFLYILGSIATMVAWLYRVETFGEAIEEMKWRGWMYFLFLL